MRIQAFGAATFIALAVLMAACSATPTPVPRTQPDAVERAVLSVSQRGSSGIDPPDDWVQLWTTNQAGGVVERCVDRASGGYLAVRVSPANPLGDQLPIAYTVIGNFSILHDPFTAPATADSIVGACVAQTPIDVRRQLVPARDAAALYSYDVTVLRRCLIEHGQEIPVAPDRAGYERMLLAGTPWSPYDRVRVPDRAAWYSLSDACPALPVDLARVVAPYLAGDTPDW